MNTTTESPSNHSRIVAGIVKRFVQIIVVFAVQATILFVGAGRIDWLWAWVYLIISVACLLVNGTILLRRNPEMVAERGHAWRKTQKWDRIVGGLHGIFMHLLIPLVAALDYRHGWTGQIASTWNIVGGVVYAGALGLSGWAMIVNAFFSSAVRIQTDRGQTVCRTGPYRFVRHPGYVGFIVQSLATPVLLGSVWGLVTGFVAAPILMVRTLLEDRMLQAELAGYQDYTKDVRYRLLPGIW